MSTIWFKKPLKAALAKLELIIHCSRLRAIQMSNETETISDEEGEGIIDRNIKLKFMKKMSLIRH